jgi:hypothetical protein
LGTFDSTKLIGLTSYGFRKYWIYIIPRFEKKLSTQLLVMLNYIRVTDLVAPRVEPAAQPKHDWDTDLQLIHSTNYRKSPTKSNMRCSMAQPVWSHLKFCHIFLLNRFFFVRYDFFSFIIINFRTIRFRNHALRFSKWLNRVEPWVNFMYTFMPIAHISPNVKYVDFYSHCIII